MGLITKMFGTYSDREVKRLRKETKQILELEPKMQGLSDEELKAKTQEFRNRLSNGETLDSLLVEAFAVCREASSRVLGMKHYEVQLIGGMVLHQGRISEMRTGEGKTLVATLPAYLNGLSRLGVHVVTVNDYLAHRDLQTMKPLYDFLGVTSQVITHESSQEERRLSYNSDITYITNNELGFDYLRDNMSAHKAERVQRKLNFAIVDEVDSILIDEARTPLIISGAGDEPTHLYRMADVFVKSLNEDDYEIDEKLSSIVLTESGVTKVETVFGLENYAEIENGALRHHINQALRGNYVMKKDKDYIVKNGEVIIVDEFTGRIMEGRRYSDGLHQGIEAKEGVKVQPENKTMATITYQNLFRLYQKLSGMTGTALTEEQEFREIYALDVIVVPTNKPIVRIDRSDKLYTSDKNKIKAIVEDVKECYKRGQPVLVGTSSIEKSETLSECLKKENIPHQVLNAKYHEIEAEIISKAGEKHAITIATNMAGRGTDIKLGEGVQEVGGLKIVGTERHESRRIDNQLRGRAGRQGDAGESAFYISFDDDLMRVFATDRVKDMVLNMAQDEDTAIENKFLSNSIRNAQKKIEGMHFQTRKDTINYDNVVNEQRKIIYEQRNKVLDGIDLKVQVENMIEDVFTSIVNIEFVEYLQAEDEILFENTVQNVILYIEEEYLSHGALNKEVMKSMNVDEIKAYVIDIALKEYHDKKIGLPEEDFRHAERQIFLGVVDQRWIGHLTALTDLKQAVQYASYKQQDPVKEYIMEGSKLFNDLIYNIKCDIVKYILNLNVIHTSSEVSEPIENEE